MREERVIGAGFMDAMTSKKIPWH